MKKGKLLCEWSQERYSSYLKGRKTYFNEVECPKYWRFPILLIIWLTFSILSLISFDGYIFTDSIVEYFYLFIVALVIYFLYYFIVLYFSWIDKLPRIRFYENRFECPFPSFLLPVEKRTISVDYKKVTAFKLREERERMKRYPTNETGLTIYIDNSQNEKLPPFTAIPYIFRDETLEFMEKAIGHDIFTELLKEESPYQPSP